MKLLPTKFSKVIAGGKFGFLIDEKHQAWAFG